MDFEQSMYPLCKTSKTSSNWVTLGLPALLTSRENPSEVHKARKLLTSLYNEYIPYVV